MHCWDRNQFFFVQALLQPGSVPACSRQFAQEQRGPLQAMRSNLSHSHLFFSSLRSGLRFGSAPSQHSVNRRRLERDGVNHRVGFERRLLRDAHILSFAGSPFVLRLLRPARWWTRSAVLLTSYSSGVHKTTLDPEGRAWQLLSGRVRRAGATSDGVRRP